MYSRILVPIDGSVASARGLDEAMDLAGHLQARMQLVHVVEPWIMVTVEAMPATVHQVAEDIRKIGGALLQECKDKVTNAGIEVDVELIETLGDSAGECIVKKAREMDADLIVCGTHGRRGFRRLLMGSDAEYIVRRAPVPVLLVRNQDPS
ncbi:universal stress protein [Peristeroidobacter soli]|jgi:nucleotide-binding universal stress UspA family protein|uniref:universal stress protein n=1 Tax=Peristeroidobacter soli TaxID=2497877 RepID=UPI00101E1CCE|nr:universal stress protein [Peristeroidobacter soli]